MSRKSLIVASLALCWTIVPGFAQAQTFLGKNESTWAGELEKSNTATRRGAAFALGKIGASAAVPALQQHLRNDPDEWVREASACALGEIAGVNGNVAKDNGLMNLLAEMMLSDKRGATRENPAGSPTVRRAAAFAIGSMGANALPALGPLTEAASSDKSPVVRQNAAWALGKLGPPALDALKKAMNDPDPFVKRDAALSMDKWKADDVRPALAELAALCREDKTMSASNSSEVRRAALIVLITAVDQRDDPSLPNATATAKQCLDDILAALADPEEEIRNNAALTLGNIGGKEAAGAVPQLLSALKQKNDTELRRQAAVSLRNIGPAAMSAVPTLIEALSDSDADLRNNAAVALGGIGKDARDAYLPLLKMIENSLERDQARIEAAFAMSRMGKFPEADEAVPRLLKVLDDPKQSPDVRERVIWALRFHEGDLRKMDGVVPAFNQVLTEDKTKENKMLRYDCAYMLGMLQQSKVERPVLNTLHDFLQDDTIGIFEDKGGKVTGTSVERSKGTSTVEERGKGDGRVMAAQALEVIGARTFAKHSGVVAELRKLADNPQTYGDLRKKCHDLLESMKKK